MRLVYVLIAVLVIATAAQTVNSILAQRRADRLEQLLRESMAARAAEAPANSTVAIPAIAPAVPLAAAKQPEAQRFVQDANIDQTTWNQLVAINREWLAALSKGAQAAELDEAARHRQARLREVMATRNVSAARLSTFEATLPGERIKARSASGNEYEGVSFE